MDEIQFAPPKEKQKNMVETTLLVFSLGNRIRHPGIPGVSEPWCKFRPSTAWQTVQGKAPLRQGPSQGSGLRFQPPKGHLQQGIQLRCEALRPQGNEPHSKYQDGKPGILSYDIVRTKNKKKKNSWDYMPHQHPDATLEHDANKGKQKRAGVQANIIIYIYIYMYIHIWYYVHPWLQKYRHVRIIPKRKKSTWSVSGEKFIYTFSKRALHALVC